LLSILGNAIVLFALHDDKKQIKAPEFKWDTIKLIIKNKSVMLANSGYSGHMWDFVLCGHGFQYFSYQILLFIILVAGYYL